MQCYVIVVLSSCNKMNLLVILFFTRFEVKYMLRRHGTFMNTSEISLHMRIIDTKIPFWMKCEQISALNGCGHLGGSL